MTGGHDRRRTARPGHVGALDGVRALAVLAVLAYHLEGEPLSGGFLGVSTFFTLSGFLITTLLLRENEATGRVDLRGFWARRWRRLLPAAMACLVLTVVAAALGGFVPEQTDAVRSGTAWTVAYLANWHQLLAGGGYLAQLSAPSPLEHFWSLAVEEQFYVVFPPLAVAVLALAARRRLPGGVAARPALGSVVLVLLLSSTALAVIGGLSPDRVYLGTDTRIAEILVGVLLAVSLRHGLAGPVDDRTRRALAVAGPAAVALLLAAWVLVDDGQGWLYRGGLVGYALLSALLVSAALVPGPVNAVLRARPLVYLGRVSYGVYLYHWPVFQVLTPAATGLPEVPLTAVRLLMTLALAALSFHLLEDPVRRHVPPLRHVRALAGVVVAASLVVGAATLPRVQPVDVAGTDALGQVLPDEPPELVQGRPWRVLLVVDDQSAALVPELRRLAQQAGTWEVAGTAGLDCAEGPRHPVCDWSPAWDAALDVAEPDAAVLLTDVWDYRAPLRAALPDVAPTDQEAVEWAVDRLAAGVEVLSGEDDRPVLWVSWPVEADGSRRADLAEVAWSVERRLTVEQPSVVRSTVPAMSAEAVAASIGTQAAGATGAGRRVMVVGDSVAASLAEGLAAWGQDNGVAVWDNARGGCGVLTEGERVGLDGTLSPEDQCAAWRQEWASAASRWRADVVVVLVGVWDASDRRLPGGRAVRGPGDPDWEDHVVDGYGDALDALAATGAEVVLVTPPCVGYEGARVPGGLGTGAPVFAGERQQLFARELLPRAVRDRPEVRLHDLFEDLCPAGEYEELVVAGHPVRPDGLHFGSAGSHWWAQQHASRLLG